MFVIKGVHPANFEKKSIFYFDLKTLKGIVPLIRK